SEIKDTFTSPKTIQKQQMKRILTLILIVACFTTSAVFAQGINISGTVTDADGQTLPGVSVQEKNSNQGTAADVNGNYPISAPADATLVFVCIGYQSQEVADVDRSVINVALAGDNSTLNDVVVIICGTQTKLDITTAVTSLGSDETQNQPV